jgi:hypothetical protein
MIIKNKSTFFTGAFLAVTFFCVLALIFAPIFGEGRNGLAYADDMFNKLAKGSSYFIPKVMKSNEKFMGTNFSAVVKFEKPELASKATKLITTAGARVQAAGSGATISGDLGKFLSYALQDADDMFQNKGAAVAKRYGSDEKEIMSSWWSLLKDMDKALKKAGKIEDAKMVSDVMKKAVEPASNFYQIEAQRVSEKAGTMTGLLVFYVIYTMWWGFAIFYMFDGIGLTMKKAKVRKEV